MSVVIERSQLALSFIAIHSHCILFSHPCLLRCYLPNDKYLSQGTKEKVHLY
jgi:hypothetical protein